MELHDYKIAGGFLISMLITFSGADAFLKFCATAVFFGYTANKWWYMRQDRKNNKINKDEEN